MIVDRGHTETEATQPDGDLNILILEDCPDDARIVQREIDGFPFSTVVRVATNQTEFETHLEVRPDIVLADFSLPRMNGLDALQIARGRYRDVPFIIVTGSVSEEVAAECFKAGVDDYLLKDRIKRLQGAIESAVAKRRHQAARQIAETALQQRHRLLEAVLKLAEQFLHDRDWRDDINHAIGQIGRAADVSEACLFQYVVDADPPIVRIAHWISDLPDQAGEPAHQPPLCELARDTAWGELRDGHTVMIPAEAAEATEVSGTPGHAALMTPVMVEGDFWGFIALAEHNKGSTYSAGEVEFIQATANIIGSAITRKETEFAFQAVEENLRQAQKMEAIGQLAGGIAHDFNNLLTIMLGHCRLIQEDLGPGHASMPELDEVVKAADRAAQLTRQLLVFSRKDPAQPEVINPNDALRSIEPFLLRSLGDDIELTAQFQYPMGRIEVNRRLVEQILMNLCINARDAMEQGGHIELSTKQVHLDQAFCLGHTNLFPGPFIRISVADDGPGMPPEVRDRVFEPFFTTKGPGHGTGLGLSIVYSITTQQGGAVEVVTAPGAGCTFHLYFPLTDQIEEPMKPDTVIEAPPQGTETILLIEDEEPLRNLTQRMLERLGYHVITAVDGLDGLEIATRHQGCLDLILSDVVMPKMSGPDSVQAIEKVRDDFKTLFMSGYTRGMLKNRGNLMGSQPVIQKPFPFDDLARKVRDVLNNQEA